MSEHSGSTAAEHQEPNYMAIFGWLTVLTIAEVAVAVVSLPRMVTVVSLVAMALTKAALVGAFFMHLKFERKTLAAIAITPLVLCVFLLLMLMPDAVI